MVVQGNILFLDHRSSALTKTPILFLRGLKYGFKVYQRVIDVCATDVCAVDFRLVPRLELALRIQRELF